MNQRELAKITTLAARMQAALCAPVEWLPLHFTGFPEGCCGDASRLLARYFRESGVDGFMLVCGEKGEASDDSWTSHAWLARGDLIVDITADQFPDAPGGIIVSSASEWHTLFKSTPPQSADFEHGTCPGDYELQAAYPRLKAVLSE